MGRERFKSTLRKLQRKLRITSAKNCRSPYAERAKMLEERLAAAPPASWPGHPAEWVVYGHLTAAVAFYRHSCVAGWLLTPDGEEILRSEYQRVSGDVDALSWLLADFDDAMSLAPLAGALIKKMILEDHSPIGKPPPSLRLDFCAVEFGSTLIAKNHFDWVLDHSTDVAYCTLARGWMTRSTISHAGSCAQDGFLMATLNPSRGLMSPIGWTDLPACSHRSSEPPGTTIPFDLTQRSYVALFRDIAQSSATIQPIPVQPRSPFTKTIFPQLE